MNTYTFRKDITCEKCGSDNVQLMDNKYFVKHYILIGIVLCGTIIGILFAIPFFMAAAKFRKQPVGTVKCKKCKKQKFYKDGELYVS